MTFKKHPDKKKTIKITFTISKLKWFFYIMLVQDNLYYKRFQHHSWNSDMVSEILTESYVYNSRQIAY